MKGNYGYDFGASALGYGKAMKNKGLQSHKVVVLDDDTVGIVGTDGVVGTFANLNSLRAALSIFMNRSNVGVLQHEKHARYFTRIDDSNYTIRLVRVKQEVPSNFV